MASDHDLLRQYAQDGSNAAFNELVRRYLDMVWSAARRQVRDPDLAHDVTQAVFIILARKAGDIRPPVLLSAWLFRTTRYTANNALKMQRRRAHYEKAAAMTRAETTEHSEDDWSDLSPQLDAAIARLPESDRDALLLRYFEKQPMATLAERFNISIDAAEKRVSRAIAKLRAMFTGRSAALSLAVLATVLGSRAVEAAPAALMPSAAAESTLATATLSAMRAGRFTAALLATAAAIFLTCAVALILVNSGLFARTPRTLTLADPAALPITSAVPDTYTEIAQLPGHPAGAQWVGFTSTGSALTAAPAPAVLGSYAVAQPQSLFRTFNTAGAEIRRSTLDFASISAAAVSSSNDRIALATAGAIHVYDSALSARKSIDTGATRILSLAFTGDQQILAVDQDQRVKLWNVDSATSRELPEKATHVAAGGSFIALADADAIRLLSANHQPILRINASSPIWAVAIHNQTLIWIDDQIHLYDLTQRREIAKRPLPTQSFRACALSPDGSHLILAMGDNTVRLFALNK